MPNSPQERFQIQRPRIQVIPKAIASAWPHNLVLPPQTMSRILKLCGAAAFSPAHLERLQKELGAFLTAEHWYFVELAEALSAEEEARLKGLLGRKRKRTLT